MEQFEFIGWVPCVNGHLDFGLTKVGIKGGFTDHTCKDKNVIEANFSCAPQPDSHHRRILLQSKVNWRDTEAFDKDRGHFRVTVTAEVAKSNSMDERSLKGNILIYPLGAEPRELALRKKMNIFDLSHKIKNNTEQLENFNRLDKVVKGNESINHFDCGYFSCSIAFEIQANGITKLNYNNPDFSPCEDTRFLVARQAFYYLKYAIHSHNHHTTEEDSLTTITPVYSRSPQDMQEAGLRLICQLKRELTGIKRTQNIDKKTHTTSDVTGIIAYIESLIASLEQSNVISKDVRERELKRFKSVKASFAAQTEKIRGAFTDKEMIKSKSKVWIGFLIVSLWGFLNFTFKANLQNKILLTSNTIYLSLILAVVFFIAVYKAILTYYESGLKPESNQELYFTSKATIASKIVIPLIFVALLSYAI
ncbi:hypothetical protein MK852_04670 [Shewanella benthica]|uniref:hypothetical protein n=1 Tax=Shewanella benthica TaxID=43661 RepID=UPI00187A792D|nr:hypothetical protein [Shewanella benthica]MBE7214185.1 hypothetical protein [Shewanella benthica]MCL1061428.1 hypothetical protein [Shewanella benthica]